MAGDGNREATELTRKRYNRFSRVYDLLELPMERRTAARWRSLTLGETLGSKLLEIGVGTGKNIPYYPQGAEVAAVDLSPGMLHRARRRAAPPGTQIHLLEADVQELPFPDGSFNGAFATFVFCSVPDPVRGLKEVVRVCRPGSRVVLLEHVRSQIPWAGRFMDMANVLMVRITGANINRRTLDNILAAGFEPERVDDLFAGIVKLFILRTPSS